MSTKSRYSYGLLEQYEDTTGERVNPTGAPIVLDDDFLYGSLVYNAPGSITPSCWWAKKIVGAGPPTVAGNANDINGTVSCTLLATVEVEDAELYAADQLVFSALQGLVFEARVSVAVLPTLFAQVSWGMFGAYVAGHDNIPFAAYFTIRANVNPALIYCDSRDGITSMDVSSGITIAAGAYHIYRIDFSDPTHIRFFIDGNEVGSGGASVFSWAASAANSKLQPFLGGYKNGGAGLGAITIDYVRAWQKRQ